MVKILDPKDAERKLKMVADPGSHGGVSANMLMRQAAQRLGIKITPETWLDFFGILACVVGTDISEGDFTALAEGFFANSSPQLLDLLEIKYAEIK